MKKIDFPISIISGWNYELISISSIAMVASGTATLETAILETPMVILGKVSLITSIIAKKLVKIPYLGLPNILADKKIVPEFIQGNAKANKIYPVVYKLIKNINMQKEMRNSLIEIRNKLGESGAAKRAALAILKEINS